MLCLIPINKKYLLWATVIVRVDSTSPNISGNKSATKMESISTRGLMGLSPKGGEYPLTITMTSKMRRRSTRVGKSTTKDTWEFMKLMELTKMIDKNQEASANVQAPSIFSFTPRELNIDSVIYLQWVSHRVWTSCGKLQAHSKNYTKSMVLSTSTENLLVST